jgi:hypothetical protein
MWEQENVRLFLHPDARIAAILVIAPLFFDNFIKKSIYCWLFSQIYAINIYVG